MSDEYKRYEHYLDTRKIYYDIESSQQESLDKQLLTLSGLSLGFSITFVEKVFPLKNAVWPYLSIGSWVAFFITVLFTVISFRCSIKTCREYREQIDKCYEEKCEVPQVLRSKYSKRIDRCNGIAFWAFMIGLVLLILFAGINAIHTSKGGSEVSDKKEKVADGLTPPPPPKNIKRDNGSDNKSNSKRRNIKKSGG